MAIRPLDDEGREAWGGFALAIGGASHVGRLRPANEDAYDRFDDAERDEILLVLADGMGGHRGGATASRMAVGTLGKLAFDGEGGPRERLHAAIERANAEIHRLASRDTMLRGMGTTLVALLLRPDGPAVAAHVGDSRIYRHREGRLERLTIDHTFAEKLLRQGMLTPEEAETHPGQHQLVRAVGTDAEVEPDFLELDLRVGDRYLLCSDGLSSMLDDEELDRLARRSVDPRAVVAWMIDAANQAGGKDNVTAMIASLEAGD